MCHKTCLIQDNTARLFGINQICISTNVWIVVTIIWGRLPVPQKLCMKSRKATAVEEPNAIFSEIRAGQAHVLAYLVTSKRCPSHYAGRAGPFPTSIPMGIVHGHNSERKINSSRSSLMSELDIGSWWRDAVFGSCAEPSCVRSVTPDICNMSTRHFRELQSMPAHRSARPPGPVPNRQSQTL